MDVKQNMAKNAGLKQARKESREAGSIGEADELTAQLPVEDVSETVPDEEDFIGEIIEEESDSE